MLALALILCRKIWHIGLRPSQSNPTPKSGPINASPNASLGRPSWGSRSTPPLHDLERMASTERHPKGRLFLTRNKTNTRNYCRLRASHLACKLRTEIAFPTRFVCALHGVHAWSVARVWGGRRTAQALRRTGLLTQRHKRLCARPSRGNEPKHLGTQGFSALSLECGKACMCVCFQNRLGCPRLARTIRRAPGLRQRRASGQKRARSWWWAATTARAWLSPRLCSASPCCLLQRGRRGRRGGMSPESALPNNYATHAPGSEEFKRLTTIRKGMHWKYDHRTKRCTRPAQCLAFYTACATN